MKYDIETLKRKMLVKYPFYGSVVANVDYKENREIQTAGTDGKTIYYNPEYLNELGLEEQIFIFAHEVCHIAFNHILRSEGKDPELWNIATDGVINQFLKRDGLKMVPGLVDITDAINYDSEKLYEKLLKEQQNGQNSSKENNQQNSSNKTNPSDGNKQSGNSNSSNKSSKNDEKNHDVGHDTHSMWKDAVKKQKESQSKQEKKESILDKLLNRENSKNEKEKSDIEKKQEEISKMGEKGAFKKNLEDKKRQLEELKEAISKQTGLAINGDIRKISNIGSAKPIIDWRYVLREAIKSEVDWSYRNATIENGIVMANLEEQPIPETEILLDTSGSINEILLKNFLRECKNILKHSRLKVGCFDTKFYGFHDIRTEKDIENMVFKGGGGTDFNAAVCAFSRRVENKIIFTDGNALMPRTSIDAIWIVFGNKNFNPKGGKVINITPEQLDRLHSFQQESSYKSRSR